jgi:hypothetical protein
MYSDEVLSPDNTMFIKEETTLGQKYDNSDGSDQNYDEEGELEIDLDYNDYVAVSITERDEPLDLSMKHISRKYDNVKEVRKTKLPTLEIRPNFNFSEFDNNNGTETNSDNKGKVITEKEVTKLLDPYVKSVYKKFSCTVCDMKFANKVKALTHVENKHVDCLQYKCPLCRASKVTRLAYESHLRRGHGARVNDYSPLIRCKRHFCVKSGSQNSKTETQSGQPYDFEFVTFLRHILSLGQEGDMSSHTWQKAIICAEWIDQDQGIFRINHRHDFAMGWYSFKVITDIFCFLILTLYVLGY